jgi:hypothetical protein
MIAATTDTSTPHENGHLVYTGTDTEYITRLYVHVHRPCTGRHICNAFRPISAAVPVEFLLNTNSAEVTMEELGWFGDIDIFNRVCQNDQSHNSKTNCSTPGSLLL